MRVLLAEDDRLSRVILERHLSKWGFDFISTSNGLEAWEVIESESDISVLITDWMMPGMNGLDLCRKVREHTRDLYLHIIMLTSKDQKTDLLSGMNAGADAFLRKPVDAPELHAQLIVAKRMIKLERKLQTKVAELEKTNQMIRHDLEAAGKVQRSMLPKDPPRIPGFETHWLFRSCDAVAGDMLNVFYVDENHLGFYVLDVSGHGVQAALLSVSLSRVLTPYSQQGGILKRKLPNSPYYRIIPPREVAYHLNRQFPVMKQSGQYFTFLYGTIHVHSLKCRFVRAGHPGPVRIRGAEVVRFEDGGGPPIGIFPNAEFDEETIQLESGDIILAYTDGIEEATNRDGEHFGWHRIQETLSGQRFLGVEEATAHLMKRLEIWGQGSDQKDDISLVGISCRKWSDDGEEY